MQRLTMAVLVFAIMATPVQLPDHGRRHANAPAVAGVYVVNTTADTVDANQGDLTCADATGHCSLRAAIMQADFASGPNTITVPSGVYLLTIPGDDNGAIVGDLDITGDTNIQGAGAGTTIVDGNGGVTHDRVFQILSSATNVSLSNLTIRGGQKLNTFDEGGGLLWDGAIGGHLGLSHVTFEGNSAYYGGGVYLNYSPVGDIVSLDHLIVHANTAATAAAGGLGVSLGDYAKFDMQASQIYSNTAYEGGGLYFQNQGSALLPSVHITTTQIYSNTAFLSAGLENHSGDTANPVILADSHLHDNHAGYYGGAIGNYGSLAISDTTLATNSAGNSGGGLYDYEGGQTTFNSSTLSGNTAQFGGGLYSELFLYNRSALTLTNSTLSGNTASRDGGGMYAAGGRVELFNTTIASNQVLVPQDVSYTGLGGGLYVSNTTSVTAVNTIIGDNTHRYQALPPEADDCYGPIDPIDGNLIENTTNCSFIVFLGGNIFGQDPNLGPLANNGGATQTHALLPTSPAIDHGVQAGCTGADGSPLTTDQRGAPRTDARCDIGAYEVVPEADLSAGQRDSSDPVRVGAPLTYTVVVTNTGPVLATGVMLTDTVPLSAAVLAVMPSQGSCNGTVLIVCNLGGLASSAQLTVTVAVTPTAASLITNTVSVAASEFDPALANNSAVEITTVVRELYLPMVIRGP